MKHLRILGLASSLLAGCAGMQAQPYQRDVAADADLQAEAIKNGVIVDALKLKLHFVAADLEQRRRAFDVCFRQGIGRGECGLWEDSGLETRRLRALSQKGRLSVSLARPFDRLRMA
ncbi:hypothetical protein BH20PSE1_BH20PSE1_26990 [soil metagenome]